MPRRLRLPVTERMLASGEVHEPLDVEDVRGALAVFKEAGVSCVAIAFLNAYANPAHELLAADLLRRDGFEGDISLSHRISGEYREYERTSTTVVDAYVRPRVTRYLERLGSLLRDAGFEGEMLVTRSGGGAMTFAEAGERPFETILSGPVAGVAGAAELAQRLGLDAVITADVGGTSFETCFIDKGRPQTKYEGRVAGFPVQAPWIDVRSIGAGGGSIAFIDAGGLMRVGPRSAGAEPGPSCYGRGGHEPTVTDAALLLGMLGEGELAGGLKLDAELARAALEPVASLLGLETAETARGIVTIATSNMANAIREITIEKGQDPRQATLVAFGGAGPVFATLLAEELLIKQIVIPAWAGNFSAWGLLGADAVQSVARTRIMRVTPAVGQDVDELLIELAEELEARGAADGGKPRERGAIEVALDMRYVGQNSTTTVRVPSRGTRLDANVDEIIDLFERDYERSYGHLLGGEVEIVSTRAVRRVALPRRSEQLVGSNGSESGSGRGDGKTVMAYSFADGDWLTFDLVSRSSLVPGAMTIGPAVIVEPTATTYIDATFEGSIDEAGALIIRRREVVR